MFKILQYSEIEQEILSKGCLERTVRYIVTAYVWKSNDSVQNIIHRGLNSKATAFSLTISEIRHWLLVFTSLFSTGW